MLFKNAVLEQHRFETQAGRRVGTECWLTFGAAVPAAPGVVLAWTTAGQAAWVRWLEVGLCWHATLMS